MRYAELDGIEAQIAELLALQRPEDSEVLRQAAEARGKAEESAQAASASNNQGPATEFKPSERLKKLYREIAKSIHPDLTTDEKERARRHAIMSEANRAYEDGDEVRLLAILDEWTSSPDSVAGEGVAAELVRVIRKVHQIKTRLADISTGFADLKRSELYRMKTDVEEAARHGRDLLKEMVTRLERDIDDRRARLRKLMTRPATP